MSETISMTYDSRNKQARAMLAVLLASGMFTINTTPNETTKAAIRELKEGKGHRAKNVNEMLDQIFA